MKIRLMSLLAAALSALLLPACGPTAEEELATATQIAADIFSTQTASAPTPTLTPSATPTPVPSPTQTPTPKPTDTPVPTPSMTPISALALLQRAQELGWQAKSYHFDMAFQFAVAVEGMNIDFPMSFAADFQSPDRMRGTYVMSMFGETFESEMILIGDTAYLQNPETGSWEIGEGPDVPFGADELLARDAFDEDDLELMGIETMEGVDLYHLHGTMSAEVLGEEYRDIAEPWRVDYWIDVDSGYTRKVYVEGAIEFDGAPGSEFAGLGAGTMSITVTLTLSDYNVEVSIEPPSQDELAGSGSGKSSYDCGQEANAITVEGPYQIPATLEGSYNVAFVYVGPRDDGGWSQSHEMGRNYVQEHVAGVQTAYVEQVAEGEDAEMVIRALACKGFDVIFTTSFGFMDGSETVAGEYPQVDIIHISGYLSNEANFGNLFGAMEDMKYLAGMLAGSRAKTDGNPKIGYIATYPIPELMRLGNAFALGVQKTCPECTIDVRWIFTWHDPMIESEAATSLFDQGAQVVLNAADTSAPAKAAPDGKWAITGDYSGNCTLDSCLTSTYWNWGPVYAQIVEDSRAGTWVGDWHYFDADSGGLGLYGFMDGQTLQPGLADLPPADLDLVRQTLERMLAGEFDRFDLFAGPIMDNQGNIVVPSGETLDQLDLDGFSQYGSPCEICMYWWNENVTAELPELE